ncbi:small membrane A-kinase anchor protein [Salminus brasiliensis]|uniref:small membrane A-kinase anchor protein n=1 Tax=Salminus brasiliensis TaxID=930266 RepID=UPI003B830AA5
MGCVKSKHSEATQNSESVERVDGRPGRKRGEKAILVYAETGSAEDSPRVNPVLLDYAQRLSEEIVARAVQQWAEVDSRYSDIPYIECDVP